jgi:putative radical SAM enzyme (TIGR03279 family)
MRASAPVIVEVVPGSPAAEAGLAPGDEILSIDGITPRDVIDYQILVDDDDPVVVIRRGSFEHDVALAKGAGQPAGIRLANSLFDRLRTCDNKCEFCFIYQLPQGLRESLYLKDDDYRLSFLYGNFTTLTRMKEADYERIVVQRLSPLYVSIHSTDPELRARILHNKKGATSLEWLRRLLGAGIEIHGQVVACPGINTGAELDTTLAGVLERYPTLASIGVVPLGVSRYNSEPAMRPHTPAEFADDIDRIERWQDVFMTELGHRMVFASDEYYLGAGRPFPAEEAYDGFPQLENGIGLARALEADVLALAEASPVEAAPSSPYRSRRRIPLGVPLSDSRPAARRIILTGALGAKVIRPLVGERAEVRAVTNDFFGGNIGVTGLLTAADVEREVRQGPPDADYFLPDVCLSEGRFIDDRRPEDVEAATGRRIVVVPTTAAGLVTACGGART